MAITVGSVSVDVVPDVRRFGSVLRKEIQPAAAKIGDDLGKELGERISEKVGAGIGDGLDKSAGPAREKSRKQGDAAGGAFSEAFRKKLAEAVKSLPDIKVKGDTSQAQEALQAVRAELVSLRDARIGVDVDTTQALAQMERVQAVLDRLSADSANVQVRVDAAAAGSALAEIRAEVAALDGQDATVDVNVDDHGSVDGTRSRILGLIAAGVALGAALIPVAAAVAAAFAGIGVGILAGVAGVGVAVLGLQGVAGAVKALGAAQKDAGKDALAYAGKQAALEGATAALANAEANAADTRIRSAEQVARAQRNLAAAQRDATSTIRGAERDLADAQRASLQAQRDLNEARAQGKRDLEDMALQLQDIGLAQRQANLDLADAGDALRRVQADPNATARQREEAQLAFDKATQQVAELAVQQRRAAADKAKADKTGVNGTQRVQAAEQAAAAARRRVADSQQRLADAQVKAAERIAEAQRGVADAVRQQASAQRQAAASIASAQRGVEAAQRGMLEASASATKLRNSMAGLTPTGRRFATFLASTFLPQLRRIRDAAQNGILPGLQAGLTALLPVMPLVAQAVGAVAAAMGGLFAQAGEALASPAGREFLVFVRDTAPQAMGLLGRIVGGLASGLGGIVRAFAPFALQVGAAFADAAQSFGRFGQSLQDNPAFQRFLAYLKETGPEVAHILGQILQAVGRLLVGLAPVGLAVARLVGGFAALINTIPTPVLRVLLSVLVPLVATFGLLVTAMKIYATVQALVNAVMDANPAVLITLAIIALVAAIIIAYQNSETFRNVLQRTWEAIRNAVAVAWGVIQPILAALAGFVTRVLVPAFLFFFNNVVKPVWQKIAILIAVVIAAIKVQFGIAQIYLKILGAAFSWLYDHVIKPVWNNFIKPVFEALGNIIKDSVAPAFETGVKAIGKAWEKVQEIAKKPVKFIVDTVLNNGILAAYNKVAKLFKVKPDDVKVQLPKGFATGGRITGPGTPTSDSILARLSTGEHVWTAREVAAAGGHGAVEALRTGVLRGALPGFKDGGGIVGSLGRAAKAAAGSAAHGAANAASMAKEGVESVANILRNPVESLRRLFSGPLDKLKSIADSDFGKLVSAVPRRLAEVLLDKAKSVFGSVGSLVGGVFGHGGGGGKWPPAIPGVVSANTAAAVEFIRQAFGITNIGTLGSRPNASDHPLGKALDAMIAGWQSPAGISLGNRVANWFTGNPDVFGTKYVIWRGQFNDGRGWGPYTHPLGRTDPTSMHMDHVHVSFLDQGGWLEPGYNLVMNGTGQRERVLNPDQWAAVQGGGSGRQYVQTFNYTQQPLSASDVVRAQRQAEALTPAWT